MTGVQTCALPICFPVTIQRHTTGLYLNYSASNKKDYWTGADTPNLPSHSVKEFLTQEAEIINTIVNINPDTSENEYPKVMKVSNKPIETLKDFENANTRVVFMEKCGKFIAWLDADTIEKSENITSTVSWNYAVDLDWQPEEEEIKLLKLTI